jgi:hypothetical protein
MSAEPIRALDERFDVRVNQFLASTDNHLFNDADFFRLHASSAGDAYLQLVRTADRRVLATIALYDMGGGTYASPRRGTFGGLSLNGACDLPLVERFVLSARDYVKRAGAHTVEWKAAPFSHDLALASVVCNILLRHGATVSGWELNYDMRVDARAFLERIDYGNVKRIRKCLREGFSAQKLPQSACAQVHELISANRARRGYPVSMSAAQLAEMDRLFPGRMHLFGVHAAGPAAGMAAAAVCLALTPRILYVFYWGDSEGMESYSPTALLAQSIYEFCQSSDIALLDIGTATLEGKPNPGLARFKANLGFTESLKPSYRWAV